MFKIIDILIILAMVWFGYKGIKRGLILEVFSIIALLVGGWGAIYLSDITAELIGAQSETMHLLSLAITFFICILAVFLIGKLFKISVSFVISDFIDKALGFVFGVFKILFFAGIIFYYIASVDVNEKVLTANAKEKILLYKPAYITANFLLPKIKTANEVIKEKCPAIITDTLVLKHNNRNE